MPTILSITNPRWSDAAQTGVLVDVETVEFGAIEFVAMASDVEPHGRQIHAAALAGTYGEIAAHVPPPPAPPPGTADLKAAAAAKRWAVETGGIAVGGATIDTSRESQTMIAGAYAYVQAQPATTVEYKTASGWVTLDAAAMTAIALAVGAHVQACFAAERGVCEAIDAGTITTLAAVDAASWPANG